MTVITAVVPTSVIPSHPEAKVLEETLDSIRQHLPDAEIVLTFDGVRAEQADRQADYDEYVRRALWLADKHYGNVCPFVFDQHIHQVGMLRKTIGEICTSLMLFVEHDTPLEPDPIDWSACIDLIELGEADVVRFSHESSVHPEHEYLMREKRGEFLRTVQFSARPHLASVDYYRRVLNENFSPEANTFLEDVLHGAAQAWPDEHRLFLYHPEGNIRRSRHLDGRAGEPKFEEALVF